MSKFPNPFRITLLFEHSLLTLFTVNDVQLSLVIGILFCFALLSEQSTEPGYMTPDFCFPGAAKNFLRFEIGDFGSYASICWG